MKQAWKNSGLWESDIMRKLLIAVLICLLWCSAMAESVDLASMTFEQLIELREQVTQEITNRAEWKKVYVPNGLYEIGVDIPVGHWTLTPAIFDYYMYTYGNVLNETKTDISLDSDVYETGSAYKPDSVYHGIYPDTNTSIEMHEGYYILIEGDCYFTPYIRPALDF